MKIKKQLQELHNQLDKSRHELIAAEKCKDKAAVMRLTVAIETLEKRIDSAKKQQNRERNDKAQKIKDLPFQRVLSKAEQGNLGALKKSVRGLVVVHPLTAQGKEMGIKEVTGFAPAEF